MSTLRAWQQGLLRLDACPWPGPRPMRDARQFANQLIGRADESQRFAMTVRSNDIIQLSGLSGVGKSSMLNISLREALQQHQFHIFVCDDWNSGAEDVDAETFIARRIREQLPRTIRVNDDESITEQLDRRYPNKGVLVLDQFEELIRYQPQLFHNILRWIESTTQEFRVKIVISLRSEYEHYLDQLQVGPFKLALHRIPPITDGSIIEEIIASGRRLPDGRSPITAAASAALVQLWNEEHEERPWSEVGLLHLQAVLYVLWHTRRSDQIDRVDVEELSGGAAINTGVFEHGLAQSVAVALEHCERCCQPDRTVGWDGIDVVQSTRARSLILEMSRFLSSGGYKISHERGTLARLAMEREIRLLEDHPSGLSEGRSAAERLARATDDPSLLSTDSTADGNGAVDWLSATREQLLGGPFANGSATYPWLNDPEDLTSGVMLGMDPAQVLVEEYRSFYFGLEWLRACELVRLTTPAPGQTMVTLIHDRYAHGLEQWRRSLVQGPRAAIMRVTAVRGQTFDWPLDPAPTEFVGSIDRDQVVADVRWVSCRITAGFRHVMFVNCDFRGSTFKRCEFEGVSFVNCLMDGVTFQECTISGEPAPPAEIPLDRIDELPSFYVPGPEGLIRALLRAREISAGSRIPTELFSRTSGLPAVPGLDRSVAAFPCEPQPGGLVMYGGRLSSLIVRGCRFIRGGTLALRSVAGTSLEFSEQIEARVQIHGSAIRGLTVTRPVGDGAEPSASASFDFTFNQSKLMNVWFGVDLRGEAIFTDCVAWQVFNSSSRDDFSVRADDTANYGFVNTEEPQVPEDSRLSRSGLGDAIEVVHRTSTQTDFRSRAVESSAIPTESAGSRPG